MQRPEGGGGSATAALSSVGKVAKKVAKKVSSSRSSGSSSRSRSSSSRSSGGGSYSAPSRSSGGGGSRYSVPESRPKPAPKPPSINSYLGTDSIYQQAVSGGKRTLADYISELTRRRGEAGTQYNQTKGNMERDRTTQLDDLKNEFASRGLIQSGLYGQEQGKFQQQFTDQATALDQQQTGLLADLLGQEKNYRREQDLALQAAKQEALQRRASKFKIGA